MNPGIFILIATMTVAGGMTVFYNFANLLIVQIVGGVIIFVSFISLWSVNKATVLNRLAFQSLDFSMTPMLEKRRILEEFRYYAASAEDRVFAALSPMILLIFFLSLAI